MRKDRIAEWLLAQVTSRERAVSTVGDLEEGAARRGAAWFWSNVLRTAGSLLWRGIADAPGPMLGLAFRAWLVSMALYAVFLLGIIVLSAVYGLAYGMLASSGTGSVNAAGAVPTGLFKALGFGAAALCQFQVGRWIARRAPGREMSACLALIVIQWIPLTVIGLAVFLATRNPVWLPELNPNILLLDLPLLVRAYWVRRLAAR
jgi:hypothetical protein